MNLQSSTLINNESDKPFHLQQAEQIQAFRDAWQKAGHEREPRVSVSRSIFALVDDRDRAYFGLRNQDTDEIGFIDAKTQAIFGRAYAAEPDVLIQQLKEDEAIAAADTLLLTVPNQLGVDYTPTSSTASSPTWRLRSAGDKPAGGQPEAHRCTMTGTGMIARRPPPAGRPLSWTSRPSFIRGLGTGCCRADLPSGWHHACRPASCRDFRRQDIPP